MKTCKHCGTPFNSPRPLQAVCSPLCASKWVKAAKKAEAVQTRERKAALKRIPDLIREAQTAFNAFVRARDETQPCICCGRFPMSNAWHSWDCGHYRSTGSASHLRFNEDNAHRQLVICNRHGAGRAVDYRIGLIHRIGLERVEALENNNTPKKWQRDELIAIKATYTQRLKDSKKETA